MLEEKYDNPKEKFSTKMFEIEVFTILLNSKRVKKWNNRFIDVDADLKLNESSIQKLKEDGVI